MESQNVQDRIYGQLIEQDSPATLFLMNGFQMRGKIKAHDAYTIVIIDFEGKQHMIYKHALSTVVPRDKIDVK